MVRLSANGNAELGAEFIHGDAAETRALLRAAGVETFPTGGESWILSGTDLLERDDNDDFLSGRAHLRVSRNARGGRERRSFFTTL